MPGRAVDGTWAGRPPAADDTMPGRGGMPPLATQPPRPDVPGPPEGRRAARRPGATDTDPGRRRAREDDVPAATPAREEPPRPPARRLISLAVAVVTGLITVGLVFGAQATRESYGAVILGVQVLFVVAWTVASRPPAPRVVAAVGLAAAVAADAAALWVRPASLAPLAYVTAGAFVAGVVGQLIRPAGRVRVTESLGSALAVVLGVVAFAMLVVLTRHPGGSQSIVALLFAAGGAVVVARMADAVMPYPRLAPQVPRGGVGVVLGAMAGTAAAAGAGAVLVPLDVMHTAIAGLVTAVVAVVIDLSVGYAEASRRLAGDPPGLWVARHMQGPLAAFALAAPAVYASSALLLVHAL
jgi:hypothetical protein